MVVFSAFWTLGTILEASLAWVCFSLPSIFVLVLLFLTRFWFLKLSIYSQEVKGNFCPLNKFFMLFWTGL
jgi:hypothetical protein